MCSAALRLAGGGLFEGTQLREGCGKGLPDGLVGDDDLGPVFDLCGDGFELGGHDVNGLVGFALLQRRCRVSDILLIHSWECVNCDIPRATRRSTE